MDVPAGAPKLAVRYRAAPVGAGSDPRSARRNAVIARKPPQDPVVKPPSRRPATAAKTTANLAEAVKAPGTPRKKAAVAGPRSRAKPVPPPPTSKERLDQVQAVIVESLESDKGEDVVALDLAGRASFADRMVIATGLADRQISAMATHLEDELAKIGIKRVQIEGAGGSDWVLIDAGDIVIHLFKAEARELYGLERMWGADLDEPAPVTGSAAEADPKPGAG
ncbi:MAG: ribosome silencing factor [Janthinobacterium lividum]